MRILLLLFLTLAFTQELEVEGNLKVTGNIDSPTIDALEGMKPERIYRYINNDDSVFSFTVPQGKIWYVIMNRGIVKSQGKEIGDAYSSSYYIFIQNDVIESRQSQSLGNNNIALNIYEYPISGSGSYQGIDYIEP